MTRLVARIPVIPCGLAPLSFALLVALPNPASAQVPEYSGPRVISVWPPGVVEPAPLEHTLAASLTRSLVPDVLVQQADRLLLLAAPSLFNAVHYLPWVVYDADVVPEGASEGVDAIVFVGPDGLRTGWLASDRSWQSVLLDGAIWAGARLVRRAQVDSQATRFDLVGVASDGQSVIVLLADDGSGEFAFDAGVDIRSLEVLDFDGDGLDEVALLTDAGVEVRELDGSLLGSASGYGPGEARDLITTLRRVGADRDSLVWILRGEVDPEQWMYVADSTGYEGPLYLGTLNVTAVAAGDFDEDGDEDLLVTHQAGQDPLMLMNREEDPLPGGATFSMAPEHLMLFPTESEAPVSHNTFQASFADFDSDGDPDVAYAVHDEEKLVLFRGLRVDHEALLDTLTSPTWDPEAGELTFRIDQPWPYGLPTVGVEIVLFDQPQFGEDIDPVYVERQLLRTGTPLGVTLTLPEDTTDFATIYYLLVRNVTFEGGTIAAAGPPFIAGYASPPQLHHLLEIAIGPMIGVLLEGGLSTRPGQAGGIVPLPNIGPSSGTNGPPSSMTQ
ncbi:MAG: VCBS repeat-containing protein [Planctomycetota bacterium]